MTIINTADKNTSLWQAYEDKKQIEPMLFPTEGAQALGVSEFELMLASPDSQYMGNRCKTVLKELVDLDLGSLESIVRNQFTVHEKTGVYQNLKLSAQMGLMLNVGGLDIRYIMHKWHHMLSVDKEGRKGERIRSIQFYDDQGHSINKLFLKDDSSERLTRWQALIEAHAKQALEDAQIELTPLSEQADWALKELSASAKEQLHDDWLAMTDVHQFYGILKALEIDRASSYAQAPEGMTQALNPEAIEYLLEQARDTQCPIMTFVGNTGVIQIQTGTVQNIKRMGHWLNVFDKKHNDFTLHLDDSGIAQCWWVKRPIEDGYVTCVEAFDAYGRSLITFFGQRQEGQPELDQWIEITNQTKEKFAKN